jgi:hypothetical protein
MQRLRKGEKKKNETHVQGHNDRTKSVSTHHTKTKNDIHATYVQNTSITWHRKGILPTPLVEAVL